MLKIGNHNLHSLNSDMANFLHFIIILIVCTLLGYLSNDLMNGTRTGIFMGIGFVIGNILVKRRERRKQEVEKEH
ncbi:hypothetical protein SAMN02910340_00752 [Methanosarcina thermophila]|jgi:hypothetical protein|uniref:Uncharacterized protein n=1 Tax=Methanosarcina thermophila TaxID=2210 RepID=A0A1I6Y2N6_METTE|nr:MAG: hypothetical protein AAY43_09250 [Methanosarcina sp. 795]BAW30360.1 conserved hypothetical protein [Methanosarcina thermophila]GLI13283.1 hypothetical protein MTHERMMSTA1_04090 [Methanosarcina thermophila MST-A1]SFT44839.1 hypothetical protein SAMN02910340_00752 [Methanosarcina thermophila]